MLDECSVRATRGPSIDSPPVELRARIGGTRRSSTPTWSRSSSPRATGCPTGSPTRRGPATSKPAFKKLALLHPQRPARVLVAGVGDARASSTPSACGSLGALAAKRAAGARGDLARLGRARRHASARVGRRAGRGDDPGRLPLRPLPLARPTTSRRASKLERLVLVTAPASAMRSPRRPRSRSSAAEAANRARDLQNLPAERADPGVARRPRRGDRRRPRARSRSRCSTARRSPSGGWAGSIAVSQGSVVEPRLIALALRGRRRRAAHSGWSARRSPSTAAGSRSSRRPECTR